MFFLKKNMQNQFGRNLESIDRAKVTPYTEVLFYDKGIVLFYDKMYYSFVFFLQVLWTVIVKGILHPIELFFSSTGKSFKLFFSEIPALWQPWMFIFIVVVVIIVAVMSCNYRVYVPFVAGFEPKTPQNVRTVSRTGEGDKTCKPCASNAICDRERGDTQQSVL